MLASNVRDPAKSVSRADNNVARLTNAYDRGQETATHCRSTNLQRDLQGSPQPPKSIIREYHARLADMMAGAMDAEPESIARHYIAAERFADAVPFARCDRPTQGCTAFERAIELLERSSTVPRAR